jgi:hypothetical protein
MLDKSSIEIVERTLCDAFRVFDTDRSVFIEPYELKLLLDRLTDSFGVEHPTEEDAK